MNDLQLPCDVECERAVLGSILLDASGSACDQAAAYLSTDEFSLSSHRSIYMRMQDLREKNIPIDMNTLTNELGIHREIESVGGVCYIASLTDGLPRVKNIAHHCEILVDKNISRRIIHTANAATAAAYEQSDTGKRILSYFTESLLSIESRATGGASCRPKDFSGDLIKQLAEMQEQHSRLIGYSLAIDGINHRTTGIRQKELAIIAGRPGQGKTSWAIQIAADNCIRGHAVGFFSLEMDKSALLQRIFASHGRIDFNHIRVPYLLNENERWELIQRRNEIDQWPLFIDDDADGETGLTLQQLCARMRLMKRHHGVKLFIIDYLQLVGSEGRDQREKVMRIARRLRRFAKTEDVAIIALSQMPRPRDHNMQTRPTMFDLMESGEIEQAAHLVMLIYWPTEDKGEYTHEDEIVIAKQRSGETWSEPVVYRGKYVRFEARA